MDILLGLDRGPIDFDSFEVPVHREMTPALASLKARARAAGFDLGLASGFRSFDHQCAIWNAKAEGKRELLDDAGQAIAIDQLTTAECVNAILRWSALPGASRHHWGTEIDVYDRSALGDGDSLKLTVEETSEGGIFHPFYCWLEQELECEHAVFFRPYSKDLGGVAPEPWHLSYRPVSDLYFSALDIPLLRQQIEVSEIALKKYVLENLDEIFNRYVINISNPQQR